MTNSPGSIFIYQGQEIAMGQFPWSLLLDFGRSLYPAHPRGWKIEDYKDIETLNFYKA